MNYISDEVTQSIILLLAIMNDSCSQFRYLEYVNLLLFPILLLIFEILSL